MTDRPRIFLVATEPSADLLGAALMRSLKRLAPASPVFAGVGGPRMRQEGLDSLFPQDEIAVMGAFEILPQAARLMRRIRETAAASLAFRPDAHVGIDGFGFNGRVARRLASRDFPLIHFVAPKVWAWRPGRARVLARLVDHLMVQFPFEPRWFEPHGLEVSYVGHPIIDAGADSGDAGRFRARFGLAAGERMLVVLPGSRRGEVDRLLPVFGETVARLCAADPRLRIAVPMADAVAAAVEPVITGWPGRPLALRGDEAKYDAFAAADAALAASGTVALELGIAQVPSVIAYRMNPATALLLRWLVTTRYANLVNIILDRPAVPERLQGACRSDILAADIQRLLSDPAAAEAQREAGRAVAAMLRAGGEPPADRAARVVLDLMERKRSR